ncbi:TetR/AcrR family transcriptional regulator [Dactylosporangium siamense]|uniref:TetR family transcriptional regulator n=1 Tax=Dactylosporangium siamense TaxID=685454 RepID=A0A919PRH0_9ACTN|nr:helix-turn-helix domain-containing protein [Dactylosporangium siamense]GIG48754.1 TetR family transcriptional regulator [Dactylosporangium siamense]
MAPAEQPLRADARRNRDRILAAARDAFAESGFAVPLDDIAARAGVGPGTVYRHFPTKEALFQAVITARVTDLVTTARQHADAPDPGAAFFAFLAHLGAEGAAKRDTSDAMSVPGPLIADLHAAVAVLLARAQAAGAVRAEITVDDLFTLFKSLFLAAHESTDPGRAARLLTVLSDGLRPPR